MTPKKNRINKKEADQIFATGRSVHSLALSFKFIFSKSGLPPKISFIAPKSVSKLASGRNYLRRKGYAALEKKLPFFPMGIIGVFIFKKNEYSVPAIEKEIEDILKRL